MPIQKELKMFNIRIVGRSQIALLALIPIKERKLLQKMV